MQLPPDPQQWVALYSAHHRIRPEAVRVLEALYDELLSGRRRLTYRDLVTQTGSSIATVARVVDRFRRLGVLTTTGGQFHAGAAPGGGYAEPLNYEAHWPPVLTL